jgi:ethanolamine utilization protein EutM
MARKKTKPSAAAGRARNAARGQKPAASRPPRVRRVAAAAKPIVPEPASKLEQKSLPPHDGLSIALVEVGNLTPALVVADRCAKSAGVHILGIESTDSPVQCIKLVGRAADVREAAEQGAELARQMGSTCIWTTMLAPLAATRALAEQPPAYSPLLDAYDSRNPLENHMSSSDAIGLIETQGLVAALHATDDMLKSASVQLVGKEKIGAAYVTIVIRGDVAAVQAAIAVGKDTIERLGGKLIMADVIPRPHAELAALLPK